MRKVVYQKAKDVYGDQLYPFIAGEPIVKTKKVCLFVVVLCCNKRKDLQFLGSCIVTDSTAAPESAGMLPEDIFHVRGPFNSCTVSLRRLAEFKASW